MTTLTTLKPGKRLARLAAIGLAGGALLLGAGTAQAGRGSSPRAVASAIASGSPDAIKSELERAEHLVCAACVDYVLPLIDNNDAGIREVAGWWLVRRGSGRKVFTDMLARLSQPDSVKARNAADILGAAPGNNDRLFFGFDRTGRLGVGGRRHEDGGRA